MTPKTFSETKPKRHFLIGSVIRQIEAGGRFILPIGQKPNPTRLIVELSKALKQKKFVVCRVDLKGARNSGEFLKLLHNGYYLGFFPKNADLELFKSNWLKKSTQAYNKLKNYTPLLVKPDLSAFKFSERDWTSTIDLVEELANRSKDKAVVFLQNFDALHTFKDSLKLQELLRSRMQYHAHVTYCFSVVSVKKEMEIFHSYDAPFYLTAWRLNA